MPAIPSDCKRPPRPAALPRLYWRCTLWLASNRLVLDSLALILRMLRRAMGQRRCDAILERLVKSPLFPVKRLACDLMEGDWYLAFNGLAEQYFKQRIKWRMDGVDISDSVASLPPSLPTAQSKIKVGVLAKFSGTLSFGINLFESVPDNIETYAFDIPFGGSNLSALSSHVHRYMIVEEDVEKAARINACGLDILINLDPKISHELLSRLTTPCIVNYLAGNIPLPHPKISFTGYPVSIVGYHISNYRICCEATGTALSNDMAFQVPFLYDLRGHSDINNLSWRDRRNLIFVHGSLYKMASPLYLDTIFSLMADDSDLRFAFMGRSRGRDLEQILERASAWGISDRLSYLGQFDSTRDSNGVIRDPNWYRCVDMLKHARLSPIPFPTGGASSRFESYAFGVPVVAMSLGDYCYGYVNSLDVPLGSASTPDDYMTLCKQCLYNQPFADKLVSVQRKTVATASNSHVVWQSILKCYDKWLAARPA